MAQRKNQGRTGPSTKTRDTRVAKGANRAPAANASTAITASEERNRATGRRARARIAQEQAARRRRLGIIAGAITVVVIAAIVIAALVLNQPSSQTTALVDPNALSSPPTQLAIGSKAPNFDSATIDGKHYTLAGQHGHPVLMEMFAVWCPHCQAESAVLNQLDKSYASKGLRSFSVLASPFGKDYDTSGGTDTRLADKNDINFFKNTFNVAHPILVDRNFATANKYGLVNGPGGQGFPSIYILDGNGIVRYRSTGEVPYATLAKAVDAAIKGQSTQSASSTKASHR
jgi:peroxiredoxin